MGNFGFSVPTLGNKYIDYRNPILGDSYNWNWVRPLSQVKYIAIHHSAGPDTQTPDDIARYHVNSRGWGGVGYHFIIDRNGVVYYVGDLTTARAHIYNYNHLAIGICLIGSFIDGKVPNSAQIHSAHELCSQMLFRTPELPSIDGWEDLIGHKNLGSTRCPGDAWDSWRGTIIQGIQSQPSDITTAERIAKVTQLYRVVLGREPDQGGLQYHVNSSASVEEIRKAMTESQEHRTLLDKAKNFKQAQVLAGESLTSISQTYQKIEAITKLG